MAPSHSTGCKGMLLLSDIGIAVIVGSQKTSEMTRDSHYDIDIEKEEGSRVSENINRPHKCFTYPPSEKEEICGVLEV